jgi:hypothetical protein
MPRGSRCAAERVGGVEQDDVEVATQPHVLEAVVEEEHVDLVMRGEERGPATDPVGRLDLRHPGPQERGANRALVGEERALGARAVAPRQHAGTPPGGEERAREPHGERRLPGPAGGEVADRDHGHRQGVPRLEPHGEGA